MTPIRNGSTLAVAALSLLAVLLASTATEATAAPVVNTGTVFIDATGLRPDSNREFAVYQGNRCVKYARAGQRVALPAGTYDIRVGFPSGRRSRVVNLTPGQNLTIPTGLFAFANVTPPGMRSTAPQKLYYGNTYMATGYQGQTARLYPGTYTVRYHLPTDAKPANAIRTWQTLTPIPARTDADRKLATPLPIETSARLDFTRPVTVGKQKLIWRKSASAMVMPLQSGLAGKAVRYLATEISSPAPRQVGLVFHCRGGLKVWLNGKLLRTASPNARYSGKRIEVFATLAKGVSTLLVKTGASKYGNWPFHATLESWRSYQVTVNANASSRVGSSPRPAALAAASESPAVPGIGGIVFCQVPNNPNGTCGLHPEQFRIVRRPARARICSLIPAAPTGKLTDLTGKRFVAAIQPDLSYDGRKVIFSARKTADERWNVYEMDLDGSALRQITKGLDDCWDPYYLPDGRIVFSSNSPGVRDEYDRDVAPLLFTCDADGDNPEQITFNLSSDVASIVLADGRILFTSWQHHGEHQGTAGVFSFCTVMPDGTGFMPFFGNHREANNTKSYAQQLTDGRVVFVDSAGHRHYNAGGLSAVSLRKPLTTRKILTPGMIYNGHNTAGRYASPYPLPGGEMLCSYSPGRGTHRLANDPAEDIHMGVYVFDFQSGRPGRLVFDDPNAQDFDALAIFRRPTPPVIPSVIRPGEPTGRMLCINAYLSDRKYQQRRAVVGELPPAKPGKIAGVRVVEGFGVHDKNPRKHRGTVIDILQMSFGSNTNGGTAFEQKRIVGYAPVYPDGSFNIEVPADTVLSLQTLDHNGMAIDTQLTWTWVRPGETRACIGCHESREQALANRDCQAMHSAPSFVATPPDMRRTVDFRRDVMPILEANCSLAKCHGAETKAGGLDLRKGFDLVFHRKGIRGRRLDAAMFNQAYESLLQANPARVGRLVIANSARHSPLIWRIYGKKLAFTDERNPYRKKITQMPPAPARPLSAADKKLLVEWIDLGAQWDNIPGEDILPGYDAIQSKKLAIEAAKAVAGVIPDPAKAFAIRCAECHDLTRVAGLKTADDGRIATTVRRMDAKRRGWVHDAEVPRIISHIRALRTRK